MYYPSSENKSADQLRGYREADLHLWFHLCRLLVFPWGGSNVLGFLMSCLAVQPVKIAVTLLKAFVNKDLIMLICMLRAGFLMTWSRGYKTFFMLSSAEHKI